jgi:uncharacterized membrane-anchored protein
MFAGVAVTLTFQIVTAAIVTALFAASFDVAIRPITLGILGALVFGVSASLFVQ